MMTSWHSKKETIELLPYNGQQQKLLGLKCILRLAKQNIERFFLLDKICNKLSSLEPWPTLDSA